MDVPAPLAGKVSQLRVAIGDRVSEGSILLAIETDATDARERAARPRRSAPRLHRTVRRRAGDDGQLLVIGAGPGRLHARPSAPPTSACGPSLVERHQTPRRRLPERRLHPVEGAAACRARDRRGRGDGRARDRVRQAEGRPRAADRLEAGGRREADGRPRAARARRARSRCVTRRGTTSPPTLACSSASARSPSSTASSPPARARRRCPGLPEDPRIIDSTAALSPRQIPRRLLVIGGGIIGLEMATSTTRSARRSRSSSCSTS